MNGLLLVWTNIPQDLEREFNEWYNREHMPERILGVPGFTRGRRFVAFDGGPRYLAMYETRDVSVLHSEPYLALKRSFDHNSKRFVPNFRDTRKTAGEIVARAGEGEGGIAAVVPLARTTGHDPTLRAWFGGAVLPALLKLPGVIGAWYAESTPETLASVMADIPRNDLILDALLVIEAMSEEALGAALSSLNWQDLEAHGVRSDASAARLRVAYSIRSGSTV